MTRSICKLLFVLALSFFALSAHASSCDPAASALNYDESVCAKKMLEQVAALAQEASKMEQRGEFEHMCEGLYAALIELDKYAGGEWRGEFKRVAAKVDLEYAAVLDKFMKTSCRQKPWLYQHLAQEGNAWGMYNLGDCYLKGSCKTQSDDEAMAWFQKAAEKEYVEAYIALGTIYSDGRAFREDFPVAFDWFMKAAAKGDANAQFIVANMYRNGVGVTRDLPQAAAWYGKAAAQNHAEAAAKLEEMYKAGEAKKPKKGFW